MIKTKLYNDKFVKKVDNIVDLFQWDNALEFGFPALPTDCIVINDTLVKAPNGLNDEAYNHHATLHRKNGKIYFSHTTHDYDEDASGMFTSLHYSDDNGETWNELSPIMPKMSITAVYGTTPAQWSYPSQFIDVPSGLYLMINCVENATYTPVGTIIRKINSDNTFGSILWINNGISETSRTVPSPVSGYPSYSFASEDLINEVLFYIKQPINRPKIAFGLPFVWLVQGTFSGDPLREPTVIKPYNYDEYLKVWRGTSNSYNIIQNGENTATQVLSEIPNGTQTTARRFYNYSPEIIISAGHTKITPTRTELMLFIGRKNNSTGKYEIADGDVYSITELTQITPIYAGHEKYGGEQLVFINRVGKNNLDIGWSQSKESMYYKQVNVSKLI